MNNGNAPQFAEKVKSAFSFLAKVLLIVLIIFIILWFTRPTGNTTTTDNGGTGTNTGTNAGDQSEFTSGGIIPGLQIIREIISPDIQFANQNQLFCSNLGSENNYTDNAYITNVTTGSLDIDPYKIDANGITNTDGGDIKLNNNTSITGGLRVTGGNVNITSPLVAFPVNPVHFTIGNGVLNLSTPYDTGSAYDYRFFPKDGKLTDIVDVNTTGITSGQYLRWNGTEWVASTLTIPTGSVSTASNGLNLNANDVRLGGTLTMPTAINQAGYAFSFSGGNVSVANGDFSINNGDVNITSGDINTDGNVTVDGGILTVQDGTLDVNDGVINANGSTDINVNGGNANINSGTLTLQTSSAYFNGTSVSSDNTQWALVNGSNIDIDDGNFSVENGNIQLNNGDFNFYDGNFYFSGDDLSAYGDEFVFDSYSFSLLGDNSVEIDSNNYIDISANGTTSINGFSTNISAQGGSGDLSLSSDNSLNINSSEDMNINSGSYLNIYANNGIEFDSQGSIDIDASDYFDVYAEDGISFDSSYGDFNTYLSNGSFRVETGGGNGFLSVYDSGDWNLYNYQGYGNLRGEYGVNIQTGTGYELNLNDYLTVYKNWNPSTSYLVINGQQYYFPSNSGYGGQQLTTDGNGVLTWEDAGGGGGGGGGVGDASNGNYLDGDIVKWGGSLVEDTTINIDGYRLEYQNGYVGFGTNFPTSIADNRITIAEGGINVIRPTDFSYVSDNWFGGQVAVKVAVKDKTMYVMRPSDERIAIYDVSNKNNPQWFIDFQIPSGPATCYTPMGMALNGSYLYVSTYDCDGIENDRLFVIDVRDPRDPVIQTIYDLSTLSSPNSQSEVFADIQLSGDKIYIPTYYTGTNNNITVLDIANPTYPLSCATISTGSSEDMGGLKVQGDRVYWTTRDYSDGVVGVARFSQCGTSVQSTTYGPGDRRYTGIEVSGNYAYVGRHDGSNPGVDVFDVSDVDNIQHASFVYTSGYPTSLKVARDYLYVGGLSTNIQLIDIRNPLSLEYIQQLNDGNDTYAFEIMGDYMYAARGGNGIYIFDLHGAKFNTLEAGGILTDYLTVDNILKTSNDALIGGSLKVTKEASFSGETRFGSSIIAGNCGTSGLNGLSVCNSGGSVRTNITTTYNGLSYFNDNLSVGSTNDIDNARLSVVHTTGLPLAVQLSTNGTLVGFYDSSVTQQGSITLTGSTISYNAFTGSHYAMVNGPVTPVTGQIVSMNGINGYLHDNPSSEILYGVELASSENDPMVLGSYLGVQNPLNPINSGNPHLVMAVGNGVMLVEEGDGSALVPGDLLISSEVPGYAKKDLRTHVVSYVIGKVAEPVDWSKETATVTAPDGSVKKKKLISVMFESFPRENASFTAALASGWTMAGDDKIQTPYEIVAPKLTTTIGQFSIIKTKSFSVNEGNLAIDQDGNLTTLGLLSAPKGEIQQLAVNSIKSLGGGIAIKLADGESFEITNSSNQVVLGVSSEGSIRADKAAGSGVIASGNSEVSISNSTAKITSRIIVTAQGNASLYVKSKADGSFVVGTSGSASGDLNFDYLIIN